MLAVGEQFPSYSLTATVSTDNSDKAFKTITGPRTTGGKWKVYFFWPKIFTFVCPTEIAAFGKLNKEFLDRDTQLLGGSTDSEFVHRAWRVHHEICTTCRSPCWRTSSAICAGCSHSRSEGRGRAACPPFIVDPEGVIRFVM